MDGGMGFFIARFPQTNMFSFTLVVLLVFLIVVVFSR